MSRPGSGSVNRQRRPEGPDKLVSVDPRKVELEVQLLSLLGQPTRLKLLYMLKDGERCACELDPAMPNDQSVISRHLIKLREMGILGWRKEGVSTYYWIEEPRVFELLSQVDEIIRTLLQEKAREATQVL